MDCHFHSPYFLCRMAQNLVRRVINMGIPLPLQAGCPPFSFIGLIPVLKTNSGLLNNQVIILLHGIRNGILLILKKVLVQQ